MAQPLTALLPALALALALSPVAAQAAPGALEFQESRAGDPGLTFARGVTVSPDGASVYVTGQNGDAIVMYSRSATGSLTSLGCIDDAGGAATCTTSTPGLDSARFIAVSPDNRHVYVTGGGDSAVVVLSRDLSSGVLTPVECWSTSAECGANTAPGLVGAEGIAVSRDGNNVYVAGQDQDTVVTFTRNSGTGGLSGASCIEQAGSPASCGTSTATLDAPRELAVSPDGKGVYVALATSNAIGAFLRDGGGQLTSAGTGASAGTALAVGVAVSPDSAHVYAGSVTSDAVAVFSRDASTSVLTDAGCTMDAGAGAGCTQTAEGLDGVEGVAVSPDGADVYAAGAADSAVVALSRNAMSGALGALGCLRDDPGGAGCGSAEGLGSAHGVAVSPDCRNVYVTGQSDDAVAVFKSAGGASCGGSPPAGGGDPGGGSPGGGDPGGGGGGPSEPPAPPSEYKFPGGGPATHVKIKLGGTTVVVPGGTRGVQLNADGTCSADLFQIAGGRARSAAAPRPVRKPLFRRAHLEIRKAGTYVIPVKLTKAGVRALARLKRSRKRAHGSATAAALSVPASIACEPVRYTKFDPLGFGVGTSTPVAGAPDTTTTTAVRISPSNPGGIPEGQGYRVRWRAAPPTGTGHTVTFDVVDNRFVENFELTGGQASCTGPNGIGARPTEFRLFKSERIRIGDGAQADLRKNLPTEGDQIRVAQVNLNFNELSVGRDNAGGTLSFTFRSGDGSCGLLATFNAKPERIAAPPAQVVEYAGTTDRGGQLSFSLARGERIDDLRAELSTRCQDTSDPSGIRAFDLVELFAANVIPLDRGAFNSTFTTPDLLYVNGNLSADGTIRGRLLAARSHTSGATDVISCGTGGYIGFTARPGRAERSGDADADGIPDRTDECPGSSDSGRPRHPRNGCPAGNLTPPPVSPSPGPRRGCSVSGSRPSARASQTGVGVFTGPLPGTPYKCKNGEGESVQSSTETENMTIQYSPATKHVRLSGWTLRLVCDLGSGFRAQWPEPPAAPLQASSLPNDSFRVAGDGSFEIDEGRDRGTRQWQIKGRIIGNATSVQISSRWYKPKNDPKHESCTGVSSEVVTLPPGS